MAGRETRGPDGASGRLFVDRPWVLCPAPATRPEALRAVRWLAERCGALPVEMGAQQHDEAVALVSHLPQVAASALAARLADRPGTGAAVSPHALAGPGLQDTTRIAASDPELWADVLGTNAGHVAPLVRALAADLAAAADALDALAGDEADEPAADKVRELLERGRRGRSQLPLKREAARAMASVVVGLPDRPGALAAVLACAAGADVNVEDVRVEHLPGRPRGLLELVVAREAAAVAQATLAAAGWDVLAP